MELTWLVALLKFPNKGVLSLSLNLTTVIMKWKGAGAMADELSPPTQIFIDVQMISLVSNEVEGGGLITDRPSSQTQIL